MTLNEGDAPPTWEKAFRPGAKPIHALIILAADRPDDLERHVKEVRQRIEAADCEVAFSERGHTLDGKLRGHEHFGFKDGIYASTFYMATGFHGAHVLIGTIFLIVCLVRAHAGQFKPEQHLGFEFAAWYWHFVDVVWLFLFCCIYVWGSWGATIEGAAG